MTSQVLSPYYDGCHFSWDEFSGAVGYRTSVNAVVNEVTTNTYSSTEGHTTGTVLNITIEYTLDGSTYSSYTGTDLTYTVADGAFTSPVFPTRVSYGGALTDPYNPDTAIHTIFGSVSTHILDYNSYESTEVEGQIYGCIGRNYQNKDMYASVKNTRQMRNLGPNGADAGASVSMFETDVSGGNIISFDVTFDGTKIYFTNDNEQVKCIDIDGSNETLILTAGGSIGTMTLDPLNSDTLLYTDEHSVYRYDLSTTAITTVISSAQFPGGSMSNNRQMQCLNDTVYAHFYARNNNGYVRVNIDQTNPHLETDSFVYPVSLYLDTIHKRAIVHRDTVLVYYVDSGIADLPGDPSIFSAVPRPISIDMSWQAPSGATTYGVEYSLGQPGANPTLTSVSSKTGLFHSIRNLTPGTEYTVYLYYSTSSALPSILIGTNTFTTLANVAGNHDASSYDDGSGGFDLSDLDSTSFAILNEVLNELFTTGDSLSINVASGSSVTAKFVKRGETTAIDGDAIAIPFSTTSGAGQSATLTLSDTSTVDVIYDETTEEVTISGQAYTAGQSLVIDGKKVTIVDI